MPGKDTLPIEIARQIDQICLEFERVWNSDPRPRIEQFRKPSDVLAPFRTQLFEELLRVELDALQRENLFPTAHQYVARFPDDRETILRVFAERAADSAARELTETFITNRSAADTLMPRQIGRYAVQRELGRGAFGVVYLAHDPELDCLVAIKQLRSDKVAVALGEGEHVSRVLDNLRREARLAARLRPYQGIVGILDVLTVAEDDSTVEIFFVQEYIDGGTLKDLIRKGPVAPAETARILSLVAQAMDQVHEQGIYHRDLKPGNIVLDSRGNPYVVDFGLAVDAHLQRHLLGEVSGTLPYMAPEQSRGEAHLLDGRADIWALGVILYELLSGRLPFQGQSRLDLTEEICRREPVAPRLINPQSPVELERICLKCLSKRMADRYATAGELSADLRQWLVEYEAGPVPTAPHPQVAPRIVPRGLRSFVEDDAAFFLELLPGPRDRSGLPESVGFWKQRIEEKDPDKTFRVGLLYGPSGCGKSSLVRAGVVPRLRRIAPVYVESTAADTEARLLGGMRKAAPGLGADLSLPDAVVALRENPALSGFKKVVLILDQFEQWLQARSNFGREQLIEGLRQCDGARMQALLLVRDDFWMAVTRFLRELEVDLIPGENVAAVDLFPPEHARRVLTQLGRAYGRFGEHEQPSEPQQEFVRQVVAGISRDGQVVCVRLAVFAEMVKDKEWTPRTIEQVGGTDGVGERFLEEAFSSPAANPKHRLHEQAARQVFQTLITDMGTEIRGSMRSRAELLEASGYGDRPADFDELLRILDGELRLITPTDPAGLDRQATGSSDGAYYQLTHDFLVPPLRSWLTRGQRSTRKGRAELLLGELAESWQVKPEARRLPSPLEWLSIVWWTNSSERSPVQQRMVRATTRRLARSTLTGALLLLLLAWLAFETNGSFRAKSVIQRFAGTNARELPSLTTDLKRYRRWTEQHAVAALADARARGELGHARQLELALAVLDPARAAAVFDGLDTIPVEDLPIFAELLEPHSAQLAEDLWRRFDAVREQEGTLPLKHAALLASLTPGDRRWATESEYLAHRLVSVRTAEAAYWRALLAPVGSALAPALVDVAADRTGLSTSQQPVLLDLLTEYASESPKLLARAVEHAEPHDLPELLTQLDRHPDALQHVQARLAALQPAAPSNAAAALSAEVRSLISSADGLAGGNAVFVQSLPQKDFAGLDARLRECGYFATCVRPYRAGESLNVAAVWHYGEGTGEIRWDLSREDLESIDGEMRKQGLVPVDFARYWNGAGADPGEMLWVVVWSQHSGNPSETKFIPAATLSEFRRQYTELPREYYSIRRFDIWMAPDGQPRCSMIWTQGHEIDHDARADWRYARAFGDLSPGQLQTDVRFEWIDPERRDRIGMFKHLSDFEETANLREICRCHLLMGDLKEAQEILEEPGAWEGDPERFHRYNAILFAHCGDHEQLLEHVSAYSKLESARQGVAPYLNLYAAVLNRTTQDYEQYLKMLEPPRTNIGAESLARACALLASLEDNPDERTAHVDRAVSILGTLVRRGQAGIPEALIFDMDFDPIRDTDQFHALLQELQLRQRFAAAFALSLDHESTQLFGLPPEAHLLQAGALVADCFEPHVVNLQFDQTDGSLQCASIWHRRVPDMDEEIKRSHREANLLLAAARLRAPAGLREALSKLEQPDVSSYLILNAPSLLPLSSLQTMLTDVTSATGETEVQALVLMLGAIPSVRIEPADFQTLCEKLRAFLVSRQAGVRSAVRWCLRQWNALYSRELEEIPPSPQADVPLVEFENPAGQRMLVVRPPNQVLMGSPGWEPGHEEQETRNWINIPRIYALTDTETTQAAIYQFLQDKRVQTYYEGRIARFQLNSAMTNDDRPAIGLTWRDAALFCQWLSEREDLPEDQFCYPNIWASNSAGTDLPDDYLERTGYRLPTEAEWEWAARGGVQTAPRFCGNDAQVLEGYAWFLNNSRRAMQPVARLRPNAFGFFDMLGNAMEWCDDTHDGYRMPRDGFVRSDAEGNDKLPTDSQMCAQRGGNSSQHHAEELRSANRFFQNPTYYSLSTGFRVARTMPER